MHFPFLFFPVSLLDFFDDVVVIEIVFSLGNCLEPLFSDSKSWLLDDEVWVVLFLLDDFGCYVILVEIVGAYCWNIASADEPSVGLGLKDRRNLLFGLSFGVVVASWTWFFLLVCFFESGLG